MFGTTGTEHSGGTIGTIRLLLSPHTSRLRTQSRRVVEFVVQLEIAVRDAWKPVIRYDTAHGFAHIDRYNLRGRAKKERLALSFSEALTRAERDIKENWSVYQERFLRGE